ncbi:hypothetical protein LguiA_035882 [Lonicera macranthoides]
MSDWIRERLGRSVKTMFMSKESSSTLPNKSSSSPKSCFMSENGLSADCSISSER